jgi:beta-galactosidase
VADQTATFSVTAAGTGPFTYQWYRSGVNIIGATGRSYTTPPTTSVDNGLIFTVSVTNAAGTVMSTQYILTVNTLPAITTQP